MGSLLEAAYHVEIDEGLGDLLTVDIDDAAHPGGLPGVTCPTCRAVWSQTGIAYPSVDPIHLGGRIPLEAENVPWEEYVRRRDIIRPYLPIGALILPGTEIGPLTGTARGRLADFAFSGPWNLLASPEAIDHLVRAEVTGLRAVATQITVPGGKRLPHVELEAQPHLRYAPQTIPADTQPPCPTCERWPVKPHRPLVFLADSWPDDHDVVRGREATTWIFVSPRFVEAVRSLGLRGATFTEVKLV